MAADLDDDHVRAMGELFPIAVHALSQPASVLGGYLDLLAAGVIEAGETEALERVHTAALRISDILGMLRRAQASGTAAAEVHAALLEYKTSARVGSIPG